jgi:hypothetical protein
MTRIRPLAALALALAATLPAGAAFASSDTDRPGRAERAERSERRTAEAVTPGNARFDAPAAIAAVYGAGYTAVTELEWERGGWQVKAADAEGRRVALRVDAATGAVAPRSR